MACATAVNWLHGTQVYLARVHPGWVHIMVTACVGACMPVAYKKEGLLAFLHCVLQAHASSMLPCLFTCAYIDV